VLLEFMASDITLSSDSDYDFTFAIDGTDQADLYNLLGNATFSKYNMTMVFSKIMTGLSGAVVFKPRHKKTAGTTGTWSGDMTRVFRATLFPVK